jgi:diguanylate cyclase (GGDEF)-like protein/PAS domain S-box-containing protein
VAALSEGKSDEILSIEHRILLDDGSIKFVHERGRMIYDEKGHPVRSIGTVLDITERKRLEDELRDAKAALVEAQSVAQVGSWQWDILNDHVTWSDECFRIFGLDPETFTPSYAAYLAHIHPDDRDTLISNHKRSLEYRIPFALDQRIIRADGTLRFVQQRWKNFYSRDGKPLRVSGTIQDITERKNAENALRRERDFSAAMIDALPGIFFILDANGTNVRFNANLMNVTGWSSEELARMDALRNVVPQDHALVRAKMRETLDAGHAELEIGVPHRSTGAVRQFFIVAQRVNLDDGAGVLGMGVDVTEARRTEMTLRESRRLIKDILDTVPVRIFWKDQHLVYMGCNLAFALDAGFSHPDEIVGKDDYQMGWRDQANMYRNRDREVIESGRSRLLIEEPQTTPEGKAITLLTSKIPMRNSSGEVVGVLGTYMDISDRKRAEEALQASERKYRDLFNSTRDAIILLEPSSGKFIDGNPSALSLFGIANNAELRSRNPLDLSPERQPDGRASTEEVREMIEVAMRDGSHFFEWRHRRLDGVEFPADVLLTRVILGNERLIYATVRDISERKRTLEQITYAATHDVLTGLANRAAFVEALERAIALARRDGKNLAVLYLDLDHFKDVNDTLGRPLGDLLLQEVAKRLQATVRETDIVARFGGDEFALLQTGILEPADTAVLADKMLKSISEPFSIQGREIRTGASVGIAVYGSDTPDPENLLSHADVALYRAKSDGRGTYRFFTDAMDKEVKARVTLATELREAIAFGQLFLMYQPQVDVDTGRVDGVEALVRWHHPTRGLVSPIEFIPVAETSGLIVPLGHWVLHEACRQMKEWLDAGIGPPLIAVNVSGRQFKNALELERDIATILLETALPPGFLELELTESVLVEVSREHDDVLQRLRKVGLHIAIDDFGTGYSSLEYLGRLPVNRIKIAQNFMIGLETGSSNATIVKTAIGMAHELGFDVVVEGVETAEQLELIRSFNGRKVQGYYYSKPLSAGGATAVLQTGKISPARPVS